MNIIKIIEGLMDARGIMKYGIIAAPNLPIAELNPNPKALLSVPYDYVVQG